MILPILPLIPHSPATSHPSSIPPPTVHAYLFTNVLNAADLLLQLKTGSSTTQSTPPTHSNIPLPTATYLDASRIFSLFQLTLAVTKAHLNQSTATMRTHSLQTEILLALSPGISIAHAFKHFGINKLTTNLLVVCNDPDLTARSILTSAIQGTLAGHQFDLDSVRDLHAISKIYSVPKHMLDQLAEVETIIVGTMALQGNA
ncbi:hypothetical protein BASA50_006848 [Batrachochytrium salamandrivorans]|uniref:EKC/KEOPS complex subunit CGI121 n=1 Tax=Batrachochytrium salamandrivorans TaxID=1357716 RepID=A0ABQ8FBY3_9FUNG|nr:hypothetical protein BASA50_006848 [Batrachochytrium salamandrivorans]KAH9247864.1 hypothetical protein BASA81_014508 [Batrachochytrium salamandrivorans]